MKNIIFDFGSILVNFNEDNIISNFTEKSEEKEFIKNEIICSPEWTGYGIIDSGYITYEEAGVLINDRTDNKYDKLVTNFMNNFHKYMNIQEEVIDIIKELKSKGYKIYMLSNTSEDMYNKFIKNIEYLFDGIVLSYRINMIKPHNSIYEYILNEYNLNPEESLFIDDRFDNIDTANKYGIKGRRILPNNTEDIKLVLKEYGVKYEI